MEHLDLHTRLSDCGNELGIFLYSGNPKSRSNLKRCLFDIGGAFVDYPESARPDPAQGQVVIEETVINVFMGPLHIVGALEVPSAALEAVKQATVFILDDPFDLHDHTEKVLMAATVPLDILEKEKT